MPFIHSPRVDIQIINILQNKLKFLFVQQYIFSLLKVAIIEVKVEYIFKKGLTCWDSVFSLL